MSHVDEYSSYYFVMSSFQNVGFRQLFSMSFFTDLTKIFSEPEVLVPQMSIISLKFIP